MAGSAGGTQGGFLLRKNSAKAAVLMLAMSGSRPVWKPYWVRYLFQNRIGILSGPSSCPVSAQAHQHPRHQEKGVVPQPTLGACTGSWDFSWR